MTIELPLNTVTTSKWLLEQSGVILAVDAIRKQCHVLRSPEYEVKRKYDIDFPIECNGRCCRYYCSKKLVLSDITRSCCSTSDVIIPVVFIVRNITPMRLQ